MSGLKWFMIEVLDALGVADVRIKLVRRDIVLLYHSVESKDSGFPHSVSRRNFEMQLEFLLSRFKIVSLEEMFGIKSTCPRAALTFDDAYEDMYTNAYSLLSQVQAPATVFVPTLFIEERRRLLEHYKQGGSDKEHLDWAQMREMSASRLVRFESHTHSHRNSVEHIRTLREDVLLSMDLLERRLGRRPRYLAYPFGTCNAATHKVVLSCGLDRVFTIKSLHVKDSRVQGRFNIWRLNERLEYFKLTVAGINSDTVRRLGALLSGRKARGRSLRVTL